MQYIAIDIRIPTCSQPFSFSSDRTSTPQRAARTQAVDIAHPDNQYRTEDDDEMELDDESEGESEESEEEDDDSDFE